jgi:hypothetical protein
MGGIHIGETYYDDKVPLEELIFAVEKLSGNDPQKPPVQDRFSFRKNVTKSALEIAKPFLPLFNKLNKWASSLQQEDEITYFDKLLQKVKGASCQEKQRAASEIAEQKHISPLARQVAIKLFEDALVGYEEEQSDFLETFPDTNKDTFLPAFVSIKANLATLDPEKYLKPAQEFFKEHYQRLKGTMGYKERGGILEKITGTVSDMYERLAERVKESDPTLHWRYTQQWQKLGVEHLRIKTGYMQDKHADAVNIAQHCVGYTRVINEDGSNGKKFATDYDWECLGIYAKQDNIAAFVHKDTALRNISALKRYHAEDQPIEVGLYGATSDSKQGSLENLCTALEQLRAWGNVKIVYANVLKPISEMNPSYTIDHKTLEAIAGSAIPQPNDYLGNTEAFMWSYLDTPTSYNAIEEATKDKGVLPIWISKYKLAGILQEESHKVIPIPLNF